MQTLKIVELLRYFYRDKDRYLKKIFVDKDEFESLLARNFIARLH